MWGLQKKTRGTKDVETRADRKGGAKGGFNRPEKPSQQWGLTYKKLLRKKKGKVKGNTRGKTGGENKRLLEGGVSNKEATRKGNKQ